MLKRGLHRDHTKLPFIEKSPKIKNYFTLTAFNALLSLIASSNSNVRAYIEIKNKSSRFNDPNNWERLLKDIQGSPGYPDPDTDKQVAIMKAIIGAKSACGWIDKVSFQSGIEAISIGLCIYQMYNLKLICAESCFSFTQIQKDKTKSFLNEYRSYSQFKKYCFNPDHEIDIICYSPSVTMAVEAKTRPTPSQVKYRQFVVLLLLHDYNEWPERPVFASLLDARSNEVLFLQKCKDEFNPCGLRSRDYLFIGWGKPNIVR